MLGTRNSQMTVGAIMRVRTEDGVNFNIVDNLNDVRPMMAQLES